MKKILTFFVLIALLAVAGCGGDDDNSKEEVTETPETTVTQPAETVPPTTEPEIECNTLYWFDNDTTVCGQKEFCGAYMYQGLQTFETMSECEQALAAVTEPSPTPEPTVEPPPATEPSGQSIEEALDSVISDLVLAFGNVDGEWQAYVSPDVQPLTTLEKGSVYYWYATEDSMLPGSATVLSTGWNLIVWMNETGPAVSSLEGYENAIPFVITTDGQTMQSYVYQSSAVAPLTEIVPGQTYNTFIVGPDNPVPSMSTFP